ncbi:hypothetical protein N9L68_00015 [bacterium]|nr:hypothetical protein [bacterium]
MSLPRNRPWQGGGNRETNINSRTQRHWQQTHINHEESNGIIMVNDDWVGGGDYRVVTHTSKSRVVIVSYELVGMMIRAQEDRRARCYEHMT